MVIMTTYVMIHQMSQPMSRQLEVSATECMMLTRLHFIMKWDQAQLMVNLNLLVLQKLEPVAFARLAQHIYQYVETNMAELAGASLRPPAAGQEGSISQENPVSMKIKGIYGHSVWAKFFR